MISKEDIIARLQDGDTMDEIVDDITKTINDAQDEYRVIQEKEKARAASQAEEERIAAAKYEAACMMLDGLCDYLVATGDDELLEEVHQVEIDKVIEMIDSSLELSKRLIKLKSVEFAETPFKFFGKWFS